MMDELIALAKEADEDFMNTDYDLPDCLVGLEAIERFANLVAAKERDECAKVCEPYEDYPGEHAAKIRARKP